MERLCRPVPPAPVHRTMNFCLQIFPTVQIVHLFEAVSIEFWKYVLKFCAELDPAPPPGPPLPGPPPSEPPPSEAPRQGAVHRQDSLSRMMRDITSFSAIQFLQELVNAFERIGGVEQCEVIRPVATASGIVDVRNVVTLLFGQKGAGPRANHGVKRGADIQVVRTTSGNATRCAVQSRDVVRVQQLLNAGTADKAVDELVHR